MMKLLFVLFFASQAQASWLPNIITSSLSKSRVEAANFSYSAGTPQNGQIGTWVGSLTDTGTGQIGVTITSGIFSSSPVCTCSGIELNSGTGAGEGYMCNVQSASSTALNITIKTDLGALTDKPVSVICFGAR